jgi:hypothetical protein
MLVALAALGGGAFFVASCVVSVRLLLLARRTRGLPEALVGTGLLLLGAIGYPLAIAVPMSAAQPWLQTTFMVTHAVLQTLGLGAIVLFTWRVFRPDAGWARALVGASFCGVGALAAWQSAGPGWASFAATQKGPWVYLAAFTLFSLGWAGTEALLYHRKLVLRMALGLADAVSADRMRLWSISILSAFAISATVTALRAAGHAVDPRAMGVFLGPLGILSAGSMWLAFVPPAAYLRWIAARAHGRA